MYEMIKKGGFRGFNQSGSNGVVNQRATGDIARMSANVQRDVGIEPPVSRRDVSAEVISMQAMMYR